MVARFFVYYRLFAVLFALVGVGLSGNLLTVAESQQATVFAIGALLFTISPVLHLLSKALLSTFLAVLTYLCLLAWLGITIWLLIQAPHGRPADPATARVQNRYIDDEWAYPFASLGNMFPELDQFRLGFKIVPTFDSLFTRDQSRRLNDLTTSLYHQLEADPDFHALGTVMPHAYEDFIMGRPNHGHYFLYIPKDLDRKKPAPALIFLHGSGGNFKAYTWLLSKLADDLHMVLIAPTFGFGNWSEPATSKLIYAAIHDAAKVVAIDPSQKHLMGLSNGGLGVCQAGAAMGRSFQSLILLSPVLDLKATNLVTFMDRWKSHPVLILTGETDNRVTLADINADAEKLRAHRILLTLDTVPEADHFLLFSHPDLVLQKLTAWLKNPPQPPAPQALPAEPESPTTPPAPATGVRPSSSP